jgi:hypothetical protein
MRIDTASREPRAFDVPENGAFARSSPPAPRRRDGPPVASLSSALGGEDRAVDLTALMTTLPTDDELSGSTSSVTPHRPPGASAEHLRQSPTRRGASHERFASGSSTASTGHLMAGRDDSMIHAGSLPASIPHGHTPTNQHTNRHSNVYVKNLVEDIDETALKAAFARFGAVESCCVIRDVSTNASRGFGFVKFATVREAEAAIRDMHGAHVRGRALEVKFANADSTTGGANGAQNGVGVVSDNVYVKGLPPRWSERELREFFKRFGGIVECRLLHASGTTTAGALIRFGAVEQAIAAVVHANNVVPVPGGVPLVMRFADSHGKARRGERGGERGKDSAGNSRGGSVSGGSGAEDLGMAGFGLNGVLMAQHNAASLAMLQHQLMQQQLAAPAFRRSQSEENGGGLGAASAGGSRDGGTDYAATYLANASPGSRGSRGVRRRESFNGPIDEGSAHDGSVHDGSVHSGAFANRALAFGVPNHPGTMTAVGSAVATDGGSGGWLGPSTPFGGASPSAAAGVGGGLGGLSAMFAGGADPGASAPFAPERETLSAGGAAFGPGGTQKSALERRAGSGGSLGARSHGSAHSLGSRGSSVRGGNAFGPGSALGASIGAGAGSNPRSPVATDALPYAPVSPVGSFDGGGVWARSPSLGGETSGAAGRGATELPAFVPADPSDRAETPGISAEAARDILDRLETPEPEKSPHARTADAPASEAVPEARCTLLVRGAPGASANAAELFLYRAFAPHGAVVSVRSTSGSITAEHVVQFRRAAEADAARRALDGGALGALRVTALDAP